jgi:hypothetical protein
MKALGGWEEVPSIWRRGFRFSRPGTLGLKRATARQLSTAEDMLATRHIRFKITDIFEAYEFQQGPVERQVVMHCPEAMELNVYLDWTPKDGVNITSDQRFIGPSPLRLLNCFKQPDMDALVESVHAAATKVAGRDGFLGFTLRDLRMIGNKFRVGTGND